MHFILTLPRRDSLSFPLLVAEPYFRRFLCFSVTYVCHRLLTIARTRWQQGLHCRIVLHSGEGDRVDSLKSACSEVLASVERRLLLFCSCFCASPGVCACGSAWWLCFCSFPVVGWFDAQWYAHPTLICVFCAFSCFGFLSSVLCKTMRDAQSD